MSETKLKACPFCGGKMIPSPKLPKHPDGYLKWLRFHPDNKCFLSAFSIDLREAERVEEWNTRKPMQNIMERLKEKESKYHDDYIENLEKEKTVLTNVCFGSMVGIQNAIKIVKEGGGT